MDAQNSQPAPFGVLLNSSWMSFRNLFTLIAVGAAAFGLINAVCQYGFALAFANPPQPPSLVPMIAMAAVLYIVLIIVGIVNYLYFLIVATEKQKVFGAAVKEALPLIVPSIMVSIYTFVYTYLWIPLVLLIIVSFLEPLRLLVPLCMFAIFVLAIMYGPRYALAPVLLVVERKSAKESVKRSFDVSRGYWGKIVGNLLLLGLIMMLVVMALGIVTGIGGGVAGMGAVISMQEQGMAARSLIGAVMGLLMVFATQLMQAFGSLFLVKLTATLVTHPAPLAAK